eukprot:CAMPEP_0119528562 /NCGR_PEP_ID=MMETSP1344-20130328/42733_1 /TAXON_ID=236787 /ORGANISM="Florenciella parvula, Strain CCMP2471" /LENGTH=69 /DNA_ID=CAMNT_0007567985 /DNA_START=105 /DNA_END=314 /DNA_ORIENTATION=-
MAAVPSSSSWPPSCAPASACTHGTSTSNAAALSKMPSRSALTRHTEPAPASSRHAVEARRTSPGPSRKL